MYIGEHPLDGLGLWNLPSGSSWSCPSPGNYGHGRSDCPCRYGPICEGVADVSRAPLCQLPEYMASRFIDVRAAAKARFIELQE